MTTPIPMLATPAAPMLTPVLTPVPLNTPADDEYVHITFPNGAVIHQPPIAPADRKSEPGILFDRASTGVATFMADYAELVRDDSLSLVGRARRAEPMVKNAIHMVAACWGGLLTCEKGFNERRAALVAVPQLQPNDLVGCNPGHGGAYPVARPHRCRTRRCDARHERRAQSPAH